jgi:hypothetical protein
MLITDEQNLIGVKNSTGNDVRYWDDGFGPLWLYRTADFLVGIIRATTWEDAYNCVEDEICDRATDEEQKDFVKDFGENWIEDAAWNESYGFSGNNGIYSKCLNGERLEPLTQKLLDELKYILVIEED